MTKKEKVAFVEQKLDEDAGSADEAAGEPG